MIDRSSVGIDVDLVRAIALHSRLPGRDRTSLDRLSVALQRPVAVKSLVGASRADPQDLHTQSVSHGVLLSQTQDVVASVLEVGHSTKRNAPGLRGRQGDIEPLGFVVIRDDVFSIRVSLKGRVVQAIQAERSVGAIHIHGGTTNREDPVGIRDHRRRRTDSRGANEAGCVGDASERRVNFTGCQRHNVEVVAETGREVCHGLDQVGSAMRHNESKQVPTCLH